MPFKRNYTIYQFDNVLEYQQYMLDCIDDETLSLIVFNDIKENLLNNKFRKYMDTGKKDYKLWQEIKDNYKDFIIIKSHNWQTIKGGLYKH